ncbi:MAG: Hyalin, partial [Acidimicrobiales bacterium]|nr:Hyalin [Acidimicrobiales bacterium]
GQSFLLGQAASAGYSCADEAGGSGLASCVGTIANGGSLNTSTVGAKSFTITAKDNAGNTTTKTVHYNVIYAFGGVLQPINADGSSLFKLGSTVPVKFQLRNSAGALVPSANATLTVAKISNGVIGVDVEAISTSAASTGNAFRCDGGQCIFNLATKPLSQGTYQLTITLDDGTQQKVIISLR